MRGYFASWGDRAAYAVSHVGWGLNRRARWDAMAFYDKSDFNGTELRAFAGNFLYSPEPTKSQAGTLRALRSAAEGCTVELDGQAGCGDGRLT